MNEPSPVTTPPADPSLDLDVLEHIRDLRRESEQAADQVLRILKEQLKYRRERAIALDEHRCKLEWAYFRFRVLMAVLGFVALAIFSFVAVRLIDAGAPAAASISLGFGAVSAATLFVTGRAAAPLFARRDKSAEQ